MDAQTHFISSFYQLEICAESSLAFIFRRRWRRINYLVIRLLFLLASPSLEAEKAKNVAHFNFIVCHVISNSHLSLLEIHYYSSALSLFIHHHHHRQAAKAAARSAQRPGKRLRINFIPRSGCDSAAARHQILIISKKFLSKLDPRASFSPRHLFSAKALLMNLYFAFAHCLCLYKNPISDN